MLPLFMNMLKILNCDKNSIAQKFGFTTDDVIVSFNGEPALDMLDVAYFDSQSNFTVGIDRNGKQIFHHVKKSSIEPMGWNFYDECYIEPRWCANKCLFCFVDQLPKGQRKTLYVKDDDWRLSFVSGNYVTLTNISDAEVDRIKTKKFSPIYVSVHATDDELRRKLLGNKTARPIVPLLKELASAGITMYTQVVMCPNLNDGIALQKTLNDLFDLYPRVQNVAVVPVGLTKYRSKLYHIDVVDKTCANNAIDLVESFDKACYDKTGNHFAYCSDEMYVYAGRDIPSFTYYGEFEQLENGVGLIADFRHQFDLALEDSTAAKSQRIVAICGISAKKYVEEVVQKAKSAFPKLDCTVLAVENKFFGSSVTVSGLLVGSDVLEAVQKLPSDFDTLLLPRVMLREIEDVFLDGMTLEELKKATGKTIEISADGYEFCRAILESDYE